MCHIELHSIMFFPLHRIALNRIVLNRIEIELHCIILNRIASVAALYVPLMNGIFGYISRCVSHQFGVNTTYWSRVVSSYGTFQVNLFMDFQPFCLK